MKSINRQQAQDQSDKNNSPDLHFLLPCKCLKSELNPIYHKRKVLLIDLKFLDEEKGRIFKEGLSRDRSLP